MILDAFIKLSSEWDFGILDDIESLLSSLGFMDDMEGDGFKWANLW